MRTAAKTKVRTVGLGPATALVLFGLALRPQVARAAPPPDPAPPTAVPQALCRPTLMIDGQEKRTGTAFLVQTAEAKPRLVLVMAQHLFDMSGHRPMVWSEMPARAASAACRPLDAGQVWKAGPAFAIEGAHGLGELESLRDIAVMPVAVEVPAPAAPLKLALQPPMSGEMVWLLAQTVDQTGDSPGGAFFHRGHVVQDGGFLAFVYDDKTLKLRETSGAPIVDIHGDVVGVNVGFTSHGGELFGVADTLATIQSALAEIPPAP